MLDKFNIELNYVQSDLTSGLSKIRENIDIWYEKSHENMIIFKGDADADRPNY